MKQTVRHSFTYSTLLLLFIYVLHFFLLDGFLPAHTNGPRLAAESTITTLVHHPHKRRHSGLAFIRMLEKHEGAKQKVTVPVADIPTLISHIVLLAIEKPVVPLAYIDKGSLSPYSYRLYLQDRVFRI